MAKKSKKLLTFPVIDNKGDIVAVVARDDSCLISQVEQGATWEKLALECRQILCRLFDPCPNCRTPMIPVSWTGERISIVCGDYACSKFRQPSRYVKKSDIQGLIAQISSLEMAQITRILEPSDKIDYPDLTKKPKQS